MSRPTSSRDRRAVAAVCVAAFAAAIAILHLGRNFGFFSDELDWLTLGDDYSPRTLLLPHGGQLIAVVRFLYELLPDLFGTAYLPFRLVALASLLSCAGLFFVLARRRVGVAAAAIPTILLLVFGSAGELMLSALALPFTLSIAFGLAALIAVENDTRRWDLAALGLLSLSVLSDTFGPIFAVGIVIYLVAAAEYRRIWVAAVPLALYAVWWVWAMRFDQGLASSSNITGVPGYVIESMASSLAALAGVGTVDFGSGAGGLDRLLGFAFAVLGLVGCALLVLRRRRGGTGPWLLAYPGIALAFWIGTALSANAARQPDTPRYLFFDAVIVLLITAEALRGHRPRRPVASALLALASLAVIANAAQLVRTAGDLTDEVDEARAQITMVDLAGDRAPPDFTPRDAVPFGSLQVAVPARRLLAFEASTGPLGLSVADVRAQPEDVREGADFVLASAIGLQAVPVAARAAVGGRSCRTYEQGETASLTPGGYLIRLAGGEPGGPLEVGRFADSASVPVGLLAPTDPVSISLEEDSAPDPWIVRAPGTVRICW